MKKHMHTTTLPFQKCKIVAFDLNINSRHDRFDTYYKDCPRTGYEMGSVK